MSADSIRRWADFSSCRTWRYTLGRVWDKSLPRLLFILLNPSTADEQHDDPTNRRGIGFAQSWGYGSVVFVNLFAFRTSKPSEMKRAIDPVGPENDRYIREQAVLANRVIAAWGVHGNYRRRDRVVRRMVDNMFCLGLTKDGHPKHPLYVTRDTWPIAFDLQTTQQEQSA